MTAESAVLSREDYCVIPGSIIIATTRAILLQLHDGREVWLPRSCCQAGSDLNEGDADPGVRIWLCWEKDL